MRIRLTSEHTLEWAAKEMLRCLINLKYWEEKVLSEGGYRNRQNLQRWKENRDRLLNKLEAYKSDIRNEAIVILNPEK